MINWFNKITHFIFTQKNLTTEKLAYFIVCEVVRIHELLLKIVTDHKSLFTAEFWDDLMYILKITWDLSTAYHSQTDGQTEQLNSVLKQYLQSYINYNQNNWILWLFMTEFVYNNSCHAFTKKSFFWIVYELDLRMNFLDFSEYDTMNLDLYSWVNQLWNQYAQIMKSLAKTQVYQKKYYDKKHIVKIFREENQI